MALSCGLAVMNPYSGQCTLIAVLPGVAVDWPTEFMSILDPEAKDWPGVPTFERGRSSMLLEF